MNVDQLLDAIDEQLESGAAVPFSGGKHVVDVEAVRQLMDDIRVNLPDEIRQAKNIVNDRAQIVGDARREAEAIIKKAEDRARAILSEQEIVRESQRRAAEIISNAQSQSRELSSSVANYCDNMLRNSEEQLARSVAEIKATRANLRQAAKK